MTNTTDHQLLPCPFCGGSVEFEYEQWDEESRTGDDGNCFIECRACNVVMAGYDRDDIEKRWNTRVTVETT